jgi:hypothetical protein
MPATDQTHHLSVRVYLLSRIPGEDRQTTISIEGLHEHFGELLDRGRIEAEVQRLIGDHFVEEPSPHAYFKRNGWMPLHKRLVAVELKLTRIDDALHQAINNLGFADESYVGLPSESAYRVINSKKKMDFHRGGVGVLAIASGGCRVVLRTNKRWSDSETVSQAYSVERFWLPHLKGSEA